MCCDALADDLAQKAQEMGAEKLFEYLESNLSGAIRVTDREEVLVEDFARALDRLYLKNVQSNVLEFRTHLPRYSLAGGGRKISREPGDFRRRLGGSAGGSAPDAPICLWLKSRGIRWSRGFPTDRCAFSATALQGSRQGRLVLVESLETTGNDRYA